jgi:hypothetical protein
MKKGFRILYRVAAELLDRTDRVRRYLDAVGPGETDEYRQLGDSIRRALDQLEERLPSTVATVLAATDPSDATKGLLGYLDMLSRSFITIHELLVYLPRQPVTSQTVEVLRTAFQRHHETYKPATLLGSVFNALEFDFIELMMNRLPTPKAIDLGDHRNIVLQLAICDRESPPSWAALAHELGHAIDLGPSTNLSGKATDELLAKNPTLAGSRRAIHGFARELTADLIATRVLGPAPILALMSLEYCVFPLRGIWEPSTHPTTRSRLEHLSSFLIEMYGDDFLKEEREEYMEAWRTSVDLGVRGGAGSDPSKAATIHDTLEKTVIQPLFDSLKGRLDELDLPSHKMSRASLDRCMERLKEGLPISAQGRERPALRKELETYRGKRFETPETKQAAFYALVDDFEEKPLDIQMILLSGHKRRRELLEDLVKEPQTLTDLKTVRASIKALRTLDDVLANSIIRNSIHRVMPRMKG